MADEGGLFPQHPRSGDWATLKGSMLAPHMTTPMQSTNHGDSRLNQTVMGGPAWDSRVIVQTGMTHGGGAMAK